MGFGGDKFKRYARWIRKKQVQVFVRKRLSHILAISLAMLVVVRESEIFKDLYRAPRLPSLFEVLVLVLTASTIAAAIWELFGNKLTTSPQEIRFLHGTRLLLSELEKLAYDKSASASASDRLDNFLTGFLEITSKTLCGRKQVDAGFMVKLPGGDALKLVKASRRAKYPLGLEIPLPNGAAPTGPAGVCFDRTQLVYVPKKNRKEAWPFRLVAGDSGEKYEPSEPIECWVPAPDPRLEDFRSVLCVPVAVYAEKDKKNRFGVLNFSTKARDPFLDRDFMMAECFASILSHAVALAPRQTQTA
jgi:hypothetical protein